MGDRYGQERRGRLVGRRRRMVDSKLPTRSEAYAHLGVEAHDPISFPILMAYATGRLVPVEKPVYGIDLFPDLSIEDDDSLVVVRMRAKPEGVVSDTVGRLVKIGGDGE